MRLHSEQVLAVELDDSVDPAVHQRLKVVAVEREALAHRLVVRRQLGPEPVQRDLVVVVEVLQHTHDLPYGQHIRVFAVLLLVQRN